MAESKYFEFVYFKVSPQYFLHFAEEFKKKVAFFKKHGATIFGSYSCAVGDIGEYLVIMQHDSLDKKLSNMKSLVADDEYRKFNEGFSKMVCHVFTSVTKCLPYYPLVAPSPTSFLFVRRFDVKGNPFEAAHAYHVSNEYINEKFVKPLGLKIVGLFAPIFAENAGTFYVMWDLGNGPNALAAPEEILKSVSTDQKAKESALPVFERIHGFSTKIYAAVQ